jgi:hypothetical protein
MMLSFCEKCDEQHKIFALVLCNHMQTGATLHA